MRSFIAAAVLSLTLAPAVQAEQIWLTMDQVRPYKLKTEAGQIVIGNPGIADVTVQDKSQLLLFGKSPGLTNMYIFDDNGEKIDNLIVRVRTSSEMLTLQMGNQRTTLNCTSHCERTITVGDSQAVFGEATDQAQRKFKSASGESE